MIMNQGDHELALGADEPHEALREAGRAWVPAPWERERQAGGEEGAIESGPRCRPSGTLRPATVARQ
jgi:hypothetical protein